MTMHRFGAPFDPATFERDVRNALGDARFDAQLTANLANAPTGQGSGLGAFPGAASPIKAAAPPPPPPASVTTSVPKRVGEVLLLTSPAWGALLWGMMR